MDADTIRIVAGLLFLIVMVVVTAVPYWKICDRTGLSKALAVLTIIPVAGLVVPWIIALSNWPKCATGPQKGVTYTPSELEEFKRRGLI